MSVNTVPEISPAEGVRESHTSTVGGTKPLHRFIKGEPKSIGIVMLFLGGSLFIFGIPMRMDPLNSSADNFSSLWLGILFTICGVLFVVAEHQPSKKIVTASLALSIISILGVIVAFFEFLRGLLHISYQYYNVNIHREHHNEGMLWSYLHSYQLHSVEAVFMLHSLVGAVLLIVMATFARIALRSTKTQAIVIMHSVPSE